MNKKFIPYEQALELKELGFDDPCFVYTYTGDTGNNTNCILETIPSLAKNHNLDSLCISHPTFSQAFRFFREKYNMLANVYSNASGFLFEYHDTTGGTHRFDSGFIMNRITNTNYSGCWDSYQEAELACLRKLIEIVKNK